MAFCVGQKVVCVDAQDRSHLGCGDPMEPLTEGAIYTIAQVGLHSWVDGSPVVRLQEQRNAIPGHKDWGYRAFRFRPLVEDTDRLEQFRKLIEPKELEKFKLDEAPKRKERVSP